MSTTRKPRSHGPALSFEQRTITELVALERRRVDSRERIELAQIDECEAGAERHAAFVAAFVKAAQELVPAVLAAIASASTSSPAEAPKSNGAAPISNAHVPKTNGAAVI